jgi:hypothetical protein
MASRYASCTSALSQVSRKAEFTGTRPPTTIWPATLPAQKPLNLETALRRIRRLRRTGGGA